MAVTNPSDARPSVGGFVGRERELAELGAAFHDASAARSTLSCSSPVSWARCSAPRAAWTLRSAPTARRSSPPPVTSRPTKGLAHLGLAEVLCERNELDAALGHANSWRRPVPAARLRLAAGQRPGDPGPDPPGAGDQAGARQAQGEAEEALPDTELVELFNPVPVQRARLALARGEVADVTRWVQERGRGVEDELLYAREREYLMLAQLLLAEQAPARALGLLERLPAQGRTDSVIELRALAALAHAACGDEPAATAALGETLTLGAPEGYPRVFVDGVLRWPPWSAGYWWGGARSRLSPPDGPISPAWWRRSIRSACPFSHWSGVVRWWCRGWSSRSARASWRCCSCWRPASRTG